MGKWIFKVSKLIDKVAENKQEAEQLAEIWGEDDGRQVEFPNNDEYGNFVGDFEVDGWLRRVYKDWCEVE